MRIPKFWCSEQRVGTGRDGIKRELKVWGWSFQGIEDARRAAAERIERAFDRLMGGEELGQYEYLDAPLREEVLETFQAANEETAVITRNRYGATVLNTADVLFADIDFPGIAPNGFFDAIALLFSKKKREDREREVEQKTLRHVGEWAVRHPARAFRLYRTHSGVRLLFTDGLYDPTSEETENLLRELGSDPLYLRLTRKQECFRARLSPKPWRCGWTRPPNLFPREDTAAETEYDHWMDGYKMHTAGFSVCTLLDTLGKPSADERIEQVVALHDAETGIGTGKPLA